MAARKALVIVNGEIQQLQVGDTISGATAQELVSSGYPEPEPVFGDDYDFVYV